MQLQQDCGPSHQLAASNISVCLLITICYGAHNVHVASDLHLSHVAGDLMSPTRIFLPCLGVATQVEQGPLPSLIEPWALLTAEQHPSLVQGIHGMAKPLISQRSMKTNTACSCQADPAERLAIRRTATLATLTHFGDLRPNLTSRSKLPPVWQNGPFPSRQNGLACQRCSRPD